MIVQKFGGTSVKTTARIKNVASIIAAAAASQPTVAVVSAMGETTDFLLRLSQQTSPSPPPRELATLLATGEQISIALVAMALQHFGVKALSMTGAQLGIVTENVHTAARIVAIQTDRLQQALHQGYVIVAAGFQGTTPNGDITTLGRGGSDTTAVALAAALRAETCDIYTDVNGIFTADPHLVHNAHQLDTISFEEMLEMARVGAQVIHPRAVELARKHHLTLRVRNTFNLPNQGTILKGAESMEISRAVSGTSLDRRQARLAILKVPDTPGVAAAIFGALAERHIAVDMIIQAFHQDHSVNDITFIVSRDDLSIAQSTLNEIASQLGAQGILVDEDIAKVSVIGLGLMERSEVAAKVFATLGQAGINIKMISTSDIRISCAIRNQDAERALQLLHDAFLTP